MNGYATEDMQRAAARKIDEVFIIYNMRLKDNAKCGIIFYTYQAKGAIMLAYTYIEKGKFELTEKDKPVLQDSRDAIVRVTLSSICTSDLYIKHGSVPRAVPGITVGHEMIGIVESVGADVKTVKPGDRVTVNVETYCGECFFCKRGYVNNCTDKNGGWALGCRIDGGQTEYVRVPYADQGLDIIPENVSDEQALFVGDVLATGFWAARISEITEDDTVLIIGAGPTGICTLLCARPNAIVTVVALYDEAQTLPLPDMYGKNLIFKTGGVDGCDCREILDLIAAGKIDTTPLITHTFSLADIEKAYEVFENRRDHVIKVAMKL